MSLKDWVDMYDKEKSHFDYKVDSLETNSRILLPGLFYILQYMPKDKPKEKPLNNRPIILSLGISKKDPESFLCIDLCMMPILIRIQFVQIFFDMFKNDIEKNMKDFPFTQNADKQLQIKDFNYDNLKKIDKLFPVMFAIKRYKIEHTKKVFALSFADVYKVIGKFADENWWINSNPLLIQKDFLDKCKKRRK